MVPTYWFSNQQLIGFKCITWKLVKTTDVQAPSLVVLISNCITHYLMCITHYFFIMEILLCMSEHKSRKKQCNELLHHSVQQLLAFCQSFSCICSPSRPPFLTLELGLVNYGPTGQIQLAACFLKIERYFTHSKIHPFIQWFNSLPSCAIITTI